MQTVPHHPSGRLNLGQDLIAELRRRITHGDPPDSARINEVHLARDLGVSRTPLREALIGLAAEGLVEIKPRRGFFVAPLNTREFNDLYVMRALLDPEALRLAGTPGAEQLSVLKTLNAKLRKGGKPHQVVELDNTWHRTLLAHCPNQVLLQTIEQFIALTKRYELAYFRETSHVAVAGDEHDAILAALARKDLAAACTALKQNMQSAVQPMQTWLATRRT